MKKKAVFIFILLGCLLLSGCGKEAEQELLPTQAPATAVPVMAKANAHPLYETAQNLLAPYQTLLRKADAEAPYSISHTIPEDILTMLADTAEKRQAVPANGRYTFTATEESVHTYQATAMEVESGLSGNIATPDPADETPMDDSKMGDYSVQGGGTFRRTYAWDMKEDLSQGKVEITSLLNGESAGHEIFSFCLRDNGLYFVDAAADLAVNVDALESSGTYLVAVGKMTESRLDVLEYHIPSLADMPYPETLNYDTLLLSVSPLSQLIVTGDQVTFR